MASKFSHAELRRLLKQEFSDKTILELQEAMEPPCLPKDKHLLIVTRNVNTDSCWPITTNPDAKYNRVEHRMCTAKFRSGRWYAQVRTNPIENLIRPVALTRKNSLFAGHEIGAENWALLASLVATCKLNGVEPVGYLAATMTAIIDGHPVSRINDLMPWSFKPVSTGAA